MNLANLILRGKKSRAQKIKYSNPQFHRLKKKTSKTNNILLRNNIFKAIDDSKINDSS